MNDRGKEDEDGIRVAEIKHPTWEDAPDQDFVYTGTYPPAH